MLSILITYYNQENFVSRSLDSVLNQKIDEPIEILIGDDGSQDNTCAIAREYQKKYPNKILLNIQPRDLSKKYNPVERASQNRIDLLNMAKGDYVCFLDGDDEYCDFTWLQESIDILKKDNTLVGVAHNYCEKFPDGKIITPAGIGQHAYITAKLYAKQLYTPAGTILFRNTFNKKDYNKLIKLKSFDDNDITFYYLNYGNLYCNNKVVYTYYQNDNSIWHSTNKLEKAVINAIDFEVLQKLLTKYHFQLLRKYYYAVKKVYDNKIELLDEKYDKYKHQCVNNGFIATILNWNKETIWRKNKVIVKMYFYRTIIFSQRVIDKLCRTFRGKK